MSRNIVFDRKVTGSGFVTNSLTQTRQGFSIGAGLVPAPDIAYSYGTGDFEVDAWYFDYLRLEVGQVLSLDLLGGLYDGEGELVEFAAVKSFNLWVVGADYRKSVRVGPQGQTHANPLWFGGVGATAFEYVTSHLLKDNPLDGWPVSEGTTDTSKIIISNPAGDGTGNDVVDIVINILGVAP